MFPATLFWWDSFLEIFSYSWDIRLPLTPDADKKAIGKPASLTDAFVDTLGWSTSPALVHYDTDTTRFGLCEPMNSVLTNVLAKYQLPSTKHWLLLDRHWSPLNFSAKIKVLCHYWVHFSTLAAIRRKSNNHRGIKEKDHRLKFIVIGYSQI